MRIYERNSDNEQTDYDLDTRSCFSWGVSGVEVPTLVVYAAPPASPPFAEKGVRWRHAFVHAHNRECVHANAESCRLTD